MYCIFDSSDSKNTYKRVVREITLQSSVVSPVHEFHNSENAPSRQIAFISILQGSLYLSTAAQTQPQIILLPRKHVGDPVS